jgi:hypothetical protein
MGHPSVFDILKRMSADNIVLSYQGEMDEALLESVYAKMNQHFDEKAEIPDKRKKFFLIMIECLQNVYHHQVKPAELIATEHDFSGFIISLTPENKYRIAAGNFIENKGIPHLKEKIDKMNSFSPDELRAFYQESLANAELSDKGGAGLGIVDMARKSGMPLKYEFTPVNENYSFFSLAVNIP